MVEKNNSNALVQTPMRVSERYQILVDSVAITQNVDSPFVTSESS